MLTQKDRSGRRLILFLKRSERSSQAPGVTERCSFAS